LESTLYVFEIVKLSSNTFGHREKIKNYFIRIVIF